MQTKAKSFCRNCGALCSMELTIEDGRLVSAAGDGALSPYGAYMCPKGLAAVDSHNGEDRLTHSVKRDASGAFVSIEAERAMDEIAEKLAALLAEHGPRSIAMYHGTGAYRSLLGNFLERALMSAIGSPNFFSTMTIDQSAKWVTSARMGVMASGKPNFQDVDLAVLAGNNPVVSHQTWPFAPGMSGAPVRAYAEAKRQRGLKMIVVDPRRNETARFADLVIQPLPGQDAALFAAIAHILLRDGTYNKDFCDRFVTQMDELRAAIAPFTPEMAAARADVPVEEIETAAKWIGEAKRAHVGSGSGPSMSAHSNLNDHMIEVVNALVGGYRRAGDLVPNHGALKPRVTREMAVSPTRSFEKGPKCRTADIGALMGEFPTALLPDEITTPGPDKIRALINFGGNPLMGLGDPHKAVPAFQDLELLVSLDQRMNETCRASHYVIAASQQFERHDLTVTADSAYPAPFAQYAPPIVQKPEGVIDDWEFYWGLAARLKLPLTLKYWNYGANYSDLPGGLELDMAHKPDPEEMIAHLCSYGHVSFADLKANPGGVRPNLAPAYVEPGPDLGGRLHLCPPDVAAELTSVLSEQRDSRFKYGLTCRRILEAMNSAYLGLERTRKKHPVNYAYMNPEDMREEGLEDGDSIEIASETGAIIGVAKAEERLRRGVISMAHMFGTLAPEADPRKDGAYTGRLTSLQRHLEPINFMPRFSGVPVNVKRVREEAAA